MSESLKRTLQLSRDALRLYFEPLLLIDAALRSRRSSSAKAAQAAATAVPAETVQQPATAGLYSEAVDDMSDEVRQLQEKSAEQERANERLKRAAHTDELTGLPNRRVLSDLLSRMISSVHAEDASFALLLVDLDHFKAVNDRLGHQAGDVVLKAIGQRMGQWLTTGRLARYGGDEFVLIISNGSDREEVGARVQELLSLIAQPVSVVGSEDFIVTASIGIALWPQDGADAETLLRCADQAMYSAKLAGRNGFRFFVESEVNERESISAAMSESRLLVHYEGQFDFAANAIVAMKASLRWPVAEDATMPPSTQSAMWARIERAGLTSSVWYWFVAQACRQARAFQTRLRADLRVIVGITRRQLNSEPLPQLIAAALQTAGLGANDLELELDESVLGDNIESLVPRLKQLSTLGVRICVGNFGLDHPLFGVTRELVPISSSRIDLDASKDIAVDLTARELVQDMIRLNHTRRIPVVAVGVKNILQMEVLRSLGCDAVQGPLVGAAVQADDFASLMANFGTVLLLADQSNVKKFLPRLQHG